MFVYTLNKLSMSVYGNIFCMKV